MVAAEVGRSGANLLASESFPADFSSLAPIRGFVEKWGREVGLDEDSIFRIKLAVSEACANAMEHPEQKSGITLWAWSETDRFTVDMWQAGQFQAKQPGDAERRGMGLPLMVACADEVSFRSLPEGGTRVSLSVFLARPKTD